MWRSILLLASLFAMPTAMAAACDFEYDPASVATYYRANGWAVPGTTDFNLAATPQTYGGPTLTKIPGGEIQLLAHDEYPYIIQFPAQEFVLGNDHKKMRPMQAKAIVVRYSIGAKVVAFSYGLIPVKARKSEGHWVVESEMACIFTATFVDDKGDGVFRVLVPGPFTPDLVPRWAKPQKS